MSFKSEQSKLQGQGHSKESAGKILGAAAQKAKHPSANQRKVLAAQGKKKRPAGRSAAKKAPAKKAPAKKAPAKKAVGKKRPSFAEFSKEK